MPKKFLFNKNSNFIIYVMKKMPFSDERSNFEWLRMFKFKKRYIEIVFYNLKRSRTN